MVVEVRSYKTGLIEYIFTFGLSEPNAKRFKCNEVIAGSNATHLTPPPGPARVATQFAFVPSGKKIHNFPVSSLLLVARSVAVG